MLPPPVVRVVRFVVRRDRADDVLADLERDYAQRVQHTGSTAWLMRETISLVAAYVLARLGRWRRSAPLIARDCQMVIRGLRRGGAPLVAAAALLGVGLAAILLTSGLAQTLLLRQVSSTYGEALRRVVSTDQQGRVVTRFSFVELSALRNHIGDAADSTVVYLNPVVLRSNRLDVHTMAEIVDSRYFALTGTPTVLGRALMQADDLPSASPVVVLSESFWRRHFAASPDVLGASVLLNGAGFTVVGIADTVGSQAFLGASVDAWITISQADPVMNRGWRGNVQDRWFTVFVLPRSGEASVNVRLTEAARALSNDYPDPWRQRALHTTAASVLIGSQRSAAVLLSSVLAGLAALILLAAASNVSGVLLARAAAHQRVIAIHMSLGAGYGAVIRRHLVEGVLVGALAGAVALALYLVIRVELSEIALLPTLTLRLELPWSASVVAIALLGGSACGAALACGPALWSTRVAIADALRTADGRAAGSLLVSRVRRGLVATQVCFSLVLVVGATMFVRTFNALATTDLGFPRGALVAMDFDVDPIGSRQSGAALARDVLDRVTALPDIASAAMSNRAPVDQSTPVVELHPSGNGAARISDITMYLATETYFHTVGVPILHGRAFSRADVDMAARVAIINESLAMRLWPDGDAIDRAIQLASEDTPLRIVGIAADAKYRTLTESHRPHLYRPTPPSLGMTLLARSRSDPREALQAIQRELDLIAPGLVGFFPRTLEDHLAVQLLPTRAAASAAGGLGILTVVLSGAALYALVAWFVVLRRREIGMRIALGASRQDVRRLVLRQAIETALPGLLAGLVLASALGTLARSALYEVSAIDPVGLTVGAIVLMLTTLVAAYLPSRAAMLVDPVQALRQ